MVLWVNLTCPINDKPVTVGLRVEAVEAEGDAAAAGVAPVSVLHVDVEFTAVDGQLVEAARQQAAVDDEDGVFAGVELTAPLDS